MNEVKKSHEKILKFPLYAILLFFFLCFLPFLFHAGGLTKYLPTFILPSSDQWITINFLELYLSSITFCCAIVGILLGLYVFIIWNFRRHFLYNILFVSIGLASLFYLVSFVAVFDLSDGKPNSISLELFHNYQFFFRYTTEIYAGLLLLLGGIIATVCKPGKKLARAILFYNSFALILLAVLFVIASTPHWKSVNLTLINNTIIKHPYHFFPLTLYAFAALFFAKMQRKRPSLVNHSVVIGLIGLVLMEFFFVLGEEYYDIFTITAYTSGLLFVLLVFIAVCIEASYALKWHGEFVAMLSHGIRTPLHVILGISECLKNGLEGELSEDQLNAVKQIDVSSEKILVLLNDIVDISAIQENKIQLYAVELNFNELVKRVYDEFAPKAHAKNLKISLSLPEDPIYIKGDARKIDQIIRNFISNGIKFTEAGSVKVKLFTSQKGAEFSVQDTGYGLTKAELKEIFRPFSEALSAHNLHKMGTGIGLTLSNHFAELHLGSIYVKSKKGEGSLFTLNLPKSQDRKA